MKPHLAKPESRLAILLLLGVFLIVAGASFHTWPVEVFNYDLIHDLDNARHLAEGAAIPVHGSVSSFGVFNPPGVGFGLFPGYLLFPREPVLAMRTMTILLSALSLTGLFLLLNKRFGPRIAFWSCLLYLVSTTGWYFMAELRPRAHPVFLVWILYFLDVWINDRKAWALGIVLFLLAAALYWMLEIAPLLLAAAVLAVIFRGPLRWRWLAGAAVLSLLLWMPYLKFQAERNFLDLRVLLIEQEPAHKFARYFHQQLRDAGLKRTKGHRAHQYPDYTARQTQEPASAAPARPEAEVTEPSLLANSVEHLKSAVPAFAFGGLLFLLLLLVPVSLVAALLRGCSEPAGERASWRTRWIIWITAFLCGGLLLIFTWGDPVHIVQRRFLWTWIAGAPAIVLALYFLTDFLPFKTRSRQLLRGAILSITVAGFAIHGMAFERTASWFKSKLGLVPPGEFSEVVDIVAEAVTKQELPPRIGYDIPFLAWIPAVHEIDGNSRIGIQYDLMLDYRHGIRNLNTGPLSVSREDSIRIVEHSSAQPWRQSYLDLTGYPPMEVYKKLDSHTILIKPAGTP